MGRRLRRLIPYWLRRGERTCSECHGTHAYEIEARCVACDRPFCPICIVVIAGEVFCPGCAEEA
jgi:hypothetical protein